jgi:hypothetical protein
MRTVAYRRDLAALVRRIYIHPYLLDYSGEKKIVDKPCGNAPPWPVARRGPRRFISENEAQAALREVADALKIEELLQLSARDLVTVLLLELPNLEHCSFQVGLYLGEIVTPAGLRAAQISHLPLKIMDVSLRASEEEAFHGSLFHIDQRVGALLDVTPCLETLNLHMCYGSFTGSFPTLPNLKSLCLTFSRLSERNLHGFLSSCRGLRTFSYEAIYAPYSPNDNPFRGHDHFRLSDAVRYLSLHSDTLEFLHLDLRKRGLTFYPPEPRAVLSLKKFTVLKHLFLNMDEFHSQFMAADPSGDPELLVQILPSSIASLHLAGHITEELPRLEKSLFGLAHAVSLGQFPRLQEVLWDENEKLNDEAGVRGVFTNAGVSFDYHSWPMSISTLGERQRSPHPNYIDPWPPIEDDPHI